MADVQQTYPEIKIRKYDGLALVLDVIGWLQIIGGIILFFSLLPGKPEEGYVWLFGKYMPAITWLVVGIVTGILFLGAARIINYLKDITVLLSASQKMAPAL
jgi:hypothetical protein